MVFSAHQHFFVQYRCAVAPFGGKPQLATVTRLNFMATLPPTELPAGDAGAPAIRRNLRPLLVVLILLCMLFVAGYIDRIRQREALEAEQVRWEERTAEAELRGLQLAKELAEIDSPAYLEKRARDDMGLTLPGEDVIVVLENRNAATEAEAAAAASPPAANELRTFPIWRQWADLFWYGIEES